MARVWLARMEEIIHLFSKLSHLEQLQVIETLPGMIKVDFIGGLPLLAVEQIISLLSVEDVLNSSKVSTKWHSIIINCYKYWMDVCTSAGLSENYVNSHVKDSSLIKFALNISRHANESERLLTLACRDADFGIDYVLKGHGGSLYNYSLVWVIVVKPGRYVHVCSFGTPIVYWEVLPFYDKSYFGYMKYIPDHLPYQSHFEEVFRVSWAAVYRNNLVIATNDAEWLKIDDLDVIERWIDNEVISIHAAVQLCICSKCGLIIQVSRSNSRSTGTGNMLEWMIECVILLDYLTETKRLSCGFSLLEVDSNLKESDAIFLQSLAMLSNTAANMPTATDGYIEANDQFCSSHLLFLQFNSSIIMKEVTSSDYKHSLSVLPAQRILTPNPLQFVQPLLLDLTNRRNKFRLSLTGNTIAMVINLSLFVWNIRSRQLPELQCQIDLSKAINPSGECQSRGHGRTAELQLIAVGDIYCVIQYNSSELITISVLNGRLVYRTNIKMIHKLRIDQKLVVCCVKQDWMNDIIIK